MIIKKIILENIKSYVYEEIDFSEGINCILGLNGSGKSTIIECIGIALFNSIKASSISSVLRYNETKGSIEIIFVGNDDRTYRVVRTIKPKSNTVKIFDHEKNIELYNNVSDVYPFIRNVLKIRKTRDFNRIFEQVLAVPQGQYVNAFLEKPSTRKETFDRLFDLHIYKEIADKVKGLNDEIQKEKITNLNQEIKLIEGQIINFDQDNEMAKYLEEVVFDLKNKQMDLEDKFNKNLEVKRKLEEAKQNLEISRNNRTIYQTKLDGYQSEKNRVVELLNASLKAKGIVEENLPKYLEYEINLQTIRELEIKIKLNQKLEEELQNSQKNIELVEKDIENITINVQDKSKSLQELKTKLDDIFNETYLQKFKVDEDLKAYESKKENLDKKIEENKKLINIYTDKIKDIELYKDRLVDTDYLLNDSGEDNNIELEKVEKELNKIDVIIEEINNLKIELNHVQSERQINYNNSKATQNGLCPFLNQKCKNINEESLNTHFIDLIKENDEKIEKLIERIKELEDKTINRKHLIEEKNNILNKINIYENDVIRRNKIIDAFTEKYNDLIISDISINECIDKILSKLNEDLKVENEKSLELNQEKERLIKLRTEIDSTLFHINIKENNAKDLQAKIKDIEKEIENLNSRIIFLKRNREEHNKNKNELEIKLSTNSKDKEKLENLKNANQNLIQYRDLYTINFEKSKEVDKYEKSVLEFDKVIIDLQTKINDLDIIITKLNEEYSSEKYQEIAKIHEELIKSVSENKAILDEKEKQLEDVKVRVDNMLRLKEELNEKLSTLTSYQNTVKFLTYMRDVYNRLPQELSKRYREYVAYMATNSYRAISNETVHIDIDEDYSISLIDDKNPKNIKTIDQLSGGEQMSIALSVRFAMLKQLSGLDIYFLDEPTVNLDYQRRNNIAEVVLDISQELSQMFVISHDDTFDDITEHIIKIEKEDNVSTIK